MKLKYFILTFVIAYSTFSYGQSKTKKKSDQSSSIMDLCAFYTPIASQNLFGFNFDWKLYPVKRWSTGLNWSATDKNKNINNSFGYAIVKPELFYTEFGWINQFDYIQRSRIRMNANVNNGLAVAYLIEHSTNSKYLYSQKVATNSYYIVEPGLDMHFRLSKNGALYLTLKTKYRFAFGDTRFGTQNQFSNYYLGLGLSLID